MEATIVQPTEAPVRTDGEICAFIEGVKEVFQKYGWIQNNYGSVDRGFCLVGAIDHVRATTGRFGLVPETLKYRLARRVGHVGDETNHAIIRWNDTPGRTKEHVLRLLDEMTDCRN